MTFSLENYLFEEESTLKAHYKRVLMRKCHKWGLFSFSNLFSRVTFFHI